ncbi:hypothetical protein BH23VER1_BH23VER1_31800 [soil metagenome]
MKSRRTSRRSRPPSNLRLKRGQRERDQWHVLKVATKSTKERRHLRRAQTRIALRVGGLFALAIAVVAVGKSVIGRALYGRSIPVEVSVSDFARPTGVAASEGVGGVRLAQIDIRTNGSLTRGRILEEAGVEEGQNLLKIDLAAVRSGLLALPQVSAVEVERALPDSLAITVSERIPLAWLSCPLNGVLSHTSSGGFLLDTEGHIFHCESLLREYLALPVIHVGQECRIKSGTKVDAENLRAAIDILKRTQQTMPGGHWKVKEIEVIAEYAVRARFHNHAEVVFGVRGLDRQFGDLRAVADYVMRADKDLATLNLLVERNLPATFFDFRRGDDPEDIRPAGEHPGAEGSPDPVAPAPPDRRTQQVRGILGGA